MLTEGLGLEVAEDQTNRLCTDSSYLNRLKEILVKQRCTKATFWT